MSLTLLRFSSQSRRFNLRVFGQSIPYENFYGNALSLKFLGVYIAKLTSVAGFVDNAIALRCKVER
jgi:hypothetical protein